MPNSDADVRTVSHFVRRLRRVALHPLAADDPDVLIKLASVQFTFGREADGSFVMRTPLPDEVAFESLAARVRPFTAKGDDLHFERAFVALEHLVTPEKDEFQSHREKVLGLWRDAVERSERTHTYRVITTEKEFSDSVLAYSWLYGDSMHGDHDKVENLDILSRYVAAVGVFSNLAVVAVMTLNLLRQLVEAGALELPAGAFADDVVVNC